MTKTATAEPKAETTQKVSTATTPEQHLLLLRVEECLRLRDQGKALYTKSDQIFEQIQETMEVGQRITLSDGRVFEFADNFSDSNVAFRPVGVKRFELAEVTKPRAKKLVENGGAE